MKNTSSKPAFTAAQMATVNQMIAEAVAQAVVATMQAMPSAMSTGSASAPSVKLTLAQAKEQSFTQRIRRGVAATNDFVGAGGNWAADKLAAAEVQAIPFIQKNAGVALSKTAVAAIVTGKVLSNWEDRCAVAYNNSKF
jgi:hypothetical protein